MVRSLSPCWAISYVARPPPARNPKGFCWRSIWPAQRRFAQQRVAAGVGWNARPTIMPLRAADLGTKATAMSGMGPGNGHARLPVKPRRRVAHTRSRNASAEAGLYSVNILTCSWPMPAWRSRRRKTLPR